MYSPQTNWVLPLKWPTHHLTTPILNLRCHPTTSHQLHGTPTNVKPSYWKHITHVQQIGNLDLPQQLKKHTPYNSLHPPKLLALSYSNILIVEAPLPPPLPLKSHRLYPPPLAPNNPHSYSTLSPPSYPHPSHKIFQQILYSTPQHNLKILNFITQQYNPCIFFFFPSLRCFFHCCTKTTWILLISCPQSTLCTWPTTNRQTTIFHVLHLGYPIHLIHLLFSNNYT